MSRLSLAILAILLSTLAAAMPFSQLDPAKSVATPTQSSPLLKTGELSTEQEDDHWRHTHPDALEQSFPSWMSPGQKDDMWHHLHPDELEK